MGIFDFFKNSRRFEKRVTKTITEENIEKDNKNNETNMSLEERRAKSKQRSKK